VSFSFMKVLLIPMVAAVPLAAILFWIDEDALTSGQTSSKPLIEQSVYLRKLLYSPGELSLSHDGVDCIGCHSPLRRVDDSGCIKCHTPENLKETSEGTSLDTHLVLLEMNKQEGAVKQASCIACHIEHKGKRSVANRSLKDIGHDDLLKKEIPCKDCHASDRSYHVNMTNEHCDECHTVHNWKTPFSHRQLKELDAYIDSPTNKRSVLNSKICGKCHPEAWHLATGNAKQPTVGSFECLVCHRF